LADIGIVKRNLSKGEIAIIQSLRKMKALVISHSAIQPTYHRKFEEISRVAGASLPVILRILVPDTWIENHRTLHFSLRKVHQNLSFYPGKVAFPHYSTRFFFTRGIIKHFREFRPDIIHLEEEPWTPCALQTIILRRIFCPQSRLVFRTSLSIPAKHKLGFITSLVEKITFRESDHAFILSKRAGEILIRKGYRKGMKISPNGVDNRIFKKMDVSDLRHDLGIIGNEFVIGYVGRLMRMKGLSTLLEAFYILIRHTVSSIQNPECRLLVVGSGEYKEEMLSVASRLGIRGKLILIDAVPAQDVPRYINCMDVLVLPSITTPGWVEFFGRVLVEAMVCEVPAIGSSSGEIPNVIGDAGLIFREGSKEDLKDKLTMLIENPDLRRSLAKSGFAHATTMFTWESIARDTYETYQSLLRNPH
jgi:glycosyltransferase involved in cell wall biosynthesis